MKLTSVSAAAVMTAAVVFSYLFGIPAAAVILCIASIAMIFFSIFLKSPVIVVFILAALYAAAMLSFVLSTGIRAHPTLEYCGEKVKVSGTIISNPAQSRTGDNYKYILRINSIGSTDNLKRDTILFTTPVRLSCGDRITASGKLKTVPSQMNENGFNTALFYRSQNIYTRMFAENPERNGQGFIMSPYFLSQLVYSKTDRIIYKYYYGDTAALISAILTGNTHNFSDEYYTVLNNTALKRQLHPAYLHILLLLWLVGLTRRLVPRRCRDIAAVVILGLYALISCANIGFTRCIVITALMIFYRQKDGSAYYIEALSRLLMFCALTMPMIILNVTFVLSAASGLMVVMFSPLLQKRLGFIPRRLRQRAAVIIIFALGVTPLGSVYFDGFCIYALFTPFITIPLVLILFILSPFVFLMLSVFGTAPVIGSYYDLALWLMLKLPQTIDKLPLAHILLPKPTPAALLLIICTIFFAYYYMKEAFAKAAVFRLTALGLMLSLVLSMALRIGKTDLTFVNVGQGDGAVIHTAYGATVIIDGGGGNNYSEYDPGESVFVPYLISKGYYCIDAAFVSHFHKDHVQGVIAAIRNLHVRNVFFMPPNRDEEEPTYWYNELKTAAEAAGTRLCLLTEDTTVQFDKGLNIYIYLPDKSLVLSGNENDSSLLIRAEYGGASALFTGDMSARAEREFIWRGAEVKADLLKVAHHGSKTAASEEWIGSVAPDFAVISCGEDNSYGHPAPETLNTLHRVRVLRTNRNGDIRVTADKQGIKRVSIFR
ncbi:MAG: ComEC/Rec2 family competence protein [Clostridia bacterium]|nr:ComEC/Rec2 family competence protein [Clostridia bacterium]